MKTIAILLLSSLSCFAQYGFNNYQLYTTGTNSSIGATTNSANITNAASVAQGNYALLYMRGKLTGTNGGTVSTSSTNHITAFMDTSYDGARWSNNFSWSARTATSNEFWGTTNIAVTLPYLRLRYVTNENSAALTNFYFYIGQKRGM